MYSLSSEAFMKDNLNIITKYKTKLKMEITFQKKFNAMAVGNIMEFFDFAIFGAFADIIGKEFFPSDSSEIQILKSLSIFGAAFVMRPLGGFFIGYIGDNYGRKRALEISITLMLLPSFFIGCLPNYNTLGYTATLLLVLLRLVQGLAVGGELVGAFIFCLEATHGINKAFWGAACKATGLLGSTMGIGTAALLRHVLAPDSLQLWGWRIPFLMSLLFGLVGIHLRSQLSEHEDDHDRSEDGADKEAVYATASAPLIKQFDQSFIKNDTTGGLEYELAPNTIEVVPANDASTTATAVVTHLSKEKRGEAVCAVVQERWFTIIIVCMVSGFWGCGYYSSFVWLSYFITDPSLIGHSTYADEQQQVAALPKNNMWAVNFVMNGLLVIAFPLCGRLGDYLGKVYADPDLGIAATVKLGLLCGILFPLPVMLLMCTGDIYHILAGYSLLIVMMSLFGSNLPAYLVNQFSKHQRYSGMGIAYNIAQAIFAGTAPLVQTKLVLGGNAVNIKPPVATSILTPLLINDSRIWPAYYVMSVALMSLLAITFGTPIIQKSLHAKKYSSLSVENADDTLKSRKKVTSVTSSADDTYFHQPTFGSSNNFVSNYELHNPVNYYYITPVYPQLQLVPVGNDEAKQ